MYSRRSYTGGMIPPNYSGSAFDPPRRSDASEDQAVMHRPQENEPACVRCSGRDGASRRRPPTDGAPALFRGPGGRGFSPDDLLIVALTVLMIGSGADDEAVLLMILLFVCEFV